MVRKYWLVIAFVAGIAVGWIFTRPGVVKPVEIGKEPVASAPTPLAQAETRQAEAVPAAPSAPAAGRDPAGASTPAIVPAEPEVSRYDGFSQPIDVGPLFGEQFEQARKLGLKDSLFELHQSLEREVRNDTWAYSAEADIQNSLVVETSSGNFKLEHLECRASMCELRLSARGKEQAMALSRWQEGMHGHSFDTLLRPRASSTVGHDSDSDVLMIFVRPPPKPAPLGQR